MPVGIVDENGKSRTVQQSMHPPQMLFGYTYHAMMIPPFPPKNMLILGYGWGTIAHLTHRIWNYGINMDAVDIAPQEAESILLDEENVVSLLIMDAERFVQGCKRIYDYVVIDLYNHDRIPKFVFSDSFIEGIRKITGRCLAINCTYYRWDDFKGYSKYFDVDCVKQTNSDQVLFFTTTKEND